ncbi:MAG: hypothetical protein ACYC4N_20685 [Pirellulaceae bacterium]
MKVYVYCLVAAVLGVAVTWGQDRDVPPPPAAADGGVEVLTRGPVHEAFAETITFDPEPGVVVDKAPPEAIEELPPEQKPEGANVDWIPGYWAWDDERSDFLWVSGIWRDLPPGRQWVPGYWGESGSGAQWTSGYWADANATEIDYLPEPPASLEEGPNIDAPSADHTWLPGCWIWQQNRYAWRPGYWATAQPNWVWIPAHYVWSPRGYVFNDGYYDYSVARRGVLFAPVYFNAGMNLRRGFSYSPVTVINSAVLSSHLFLRPSYGHYYFGDYYGSNYRATGFSPWFSFFSSRSGYDPFYAHQRWNHRNDGQWNNGLERDYAHRRDHEEARPPRTWKDQVDRRRRDGADYDRNFDMAGSIDELSSRKEAPLRFQRVAQEQRELYGKRGQEVRDAREQRRNLEAARDASDDAPDRNVRPVKVRLPKTPFVAQSVDRFGEGEGPPKAIEAPQPDSKIEPQRRKPRDYSASPSDPAATIREPRSIQPKVERKEQPKVARRAQPTRERTEQPTRERMDQPKVERKEQPKVERKEQPKVERKEQPRVAKREQPARERTEQPKRERTEQPKRERAEQPARERAEQPKRERAEQPKRERTETPKGGSDERAKGPPAGKGKK